jgi:hypothetical protein
VKPNADGVDDAARLDPGDVLELGWDGVIGQQSAAPVLEPAVAVLEREVQHRPLGDVQPERLATRGGGQPDPQYQPGLADLGAPPSSTEPFGMRPGTA